MEWKFLLDELLTIDRPFQSLQPFLSPDRDLTASCKRLVGKLRDRTDDDDEYDELNEEWQLFIRHAFSEMIYGERVARVRDHLVFYRVVSHKYVLYEFNTFMLRALSLLPVDADDIVCTPCLNEDVYPDSMEALLATMRTDGTVDESPTIAQTVLSMNNCLTPSEVSTIQMHQLSHELEADPLQYFLGGYDESYSYKTTMREFLETHCRASRDEAAHTVERLLNLHRDMNPLGSGQERDDRVIGHMVQITIPREQAARFAYPCVSWGKPAAIRRVENKLHAYKDTPPDGLGEGLEVLFDSREISQLQSRILAHPHLFCLHGGTTRVFHANMHFDEEEFRRRVARELEPWARRAPRLRFRKFLD